MSGGGGNEALSEYERLELEQTKRLNEAVSMGSFFEPEIEDERLEWYRKLVTKLKAENAELRAELEALKRADRNSAWMRGVAAGYGLE